MIIHSLLLASLSFMPVWSIEKTSNSYCWVRGNIRVHCAVIKHLCLKMILHEISTCYTLEAHDIWNSLLNLCLGSWAQKLRLGENAWLKYLFPSGHRGWNKGKIWPHQNSETKDWLWNVRWAEPMILSDRSTYVHELTLFSSDSIESNWRTAYPNTSYMVIPSHICCLPKPYARTPVDMNCKV